MIRRRGTSPGSYVQQNWPQVQAQITTMMGGRLVGASGSFCSAEKRDEVLSFYSAHKVASCGARSAARKGSDQ